MEDIGKKKYNVSELHLSCFDANTSGLLLYTKLGYKPYEIEKYINKENEVSALIELKKVLWFEINHLFDSVISWKYDNLKKCEKYLWPTITYNDF